MAGWQSVLDALPEPGYRVLPGWLAPPVVAALREELLARDAGGHLRPADIGRGRTQQRQQGIRGDRIAWLEPTWPAAAGYLAAIEGLRLALNRELFLGLDDYEAHYACYEAGSVYGRHVDRHAETPGAGRGRRVISTVCYLNPPDWPADAGGELLLHVPDAAPVRVSPAGGTLVVFRSDNLPHEVLASVRTRYSIAGWLRTRD